MASDGAPRRAAEQRTERRVRVAMDLAGPKLRTGPVVPGPGVMKARPLRDELGHARGPADVWLTTLGENIGVHQEGGALSVPVLDAEWPAGLEEETRVSFNDARGSRRVLEVREVHPGRVLTELWDTAYLIEGTELSADRPGVGPGVTTVAPLPPQLRKLRLSRPCSRRWPISASPTCRWCSRWRPSQASSSWRRSCSLPCARPRSSTLNERQRKKNPLLRPLRAWSARA